MVVVGRRGRGGVWEEGSLYFGHISSYFSYTIVLMTEVKFYKKKKKDTLELHVEMVSD